MDINAPNMALQCETSALFDCLNKE